MADDYSYLASLSKHPDRPGDTSNLDPQFAGNLAAAIREANASGLNIGLESGYRTPGQTGSSFDASGRSLHSYGLASDIYGLGGANSQAAQQWAAIAARHGLYNPYGIGDKSEFNHWQAVPNELTQADVPAYQRAFAQRTAPPAQQTAGTQGAASPGAPQPAGATIDTTLSRTNPFIKALGDAESNWRNIFSGVDKDYPGQPGSRSQGFLQIDLPTWKQFAPQAGVTAASPLAASEADQIKVASLLPISRFGGRTQGLLHKQFGTFDNSMTVGQLASQYGGGTTAPAPAAPGTTLTSTPPATPAASAAPSPAAAAAAPAGTTPGTTPGTTLTSTPAAPTGGVAAIGQALGLSPQAAGGFQSGLSNLSQGLGGPALQEQKPGQQAGQQQGQQQQQQRWLEIRPSPQVQPVGEPSIARNVPGPMGIEQQAQMRSSLMQQAGQALPLVSQQAQPGLSPWLDPRTGQPYGPSVPGTSLTSMGQAISGLPLRELAYGYYPQQPPGMSIGGYND